jgi:hypothetical protein
VGFNRTQDRANECFEALRTHCQQLEQKVASGCYPADASDATPVAPLDIDSAIVGKLAQKGKKK